MRSLIRPQWFLFALLVAMPAVGRCQQETKISFKVVLVADNLQESPLPNAFVYVQPCSQLASQHEVLRQWLLRNASPREPVTRSFEIESGHLIPKAMIAMVGDRIKGTVNDKFPLEFRLFDHPGSGSIDRDLKLLMVERFPVRVSLGDFDNIEAAQMLVNDHSCNRITDADGKASFTELPADMIIPFEVGASHFIPAGKRLEVTSDSVKFEKRRTFKIDTSTRTQEHLIRVKLVART